jgi:hypothetical protein
MRRSYITLLVGDDGEKDMRQVAKSGVFRFSVNAKPADCIICDKIEHGIQELSSRLRKSR